MLREYQQGAVNALVEYLGTNTGNPLIVAPTGSGKSHIIAEFVKIAMLLNPDIRVVVATHRKELLQQNLYKLLAAWPAAPVGLYSAGLKSKQVSKITIAGIQSAAKKIERFANTDILIIDECHLVPHTGDGNYQKFIKQIRDKNPNLRVVGLTATPYRLGGGLLTEGIQKIFDDACYEIEIDTLIEQGHLSHLVGKTSAIKADTSELRISGGEYTAASMEIVFNTNALVDAAVQEVVRLAGNRKSWLFFCVSIQHANHVAERLRKLGISAESISSESTPIERARVLGDFKSGKLKAVCNCEILTTGFDAPATDLIVFLRPTKSTSLYVQMAGRGMRIAEGKPNCLLLDYAGNIERHGPVNEIKVSRQCNREESEQKEIKALGKTCPACRLTVGIRSLECPECAYVFPVEYQHTYIATESAPLRPPGEVVGHLVVSEDYSEHVSKAGSVSMKVSYVTYGARTFCEWICFEHEGFARSKAEKWWQERAGNPVPKTVSEAVRRSDELMPARKIFVKKDGKFDRIVSAHICTNEQLLENVL